MPSDKIQPEGALVPGARALSRQRVSDRIVSVGLRLFATLGYDRVSTQQIADEAGITQRTLFRYFPQKSQIIFDREYDYVLRFEGFLDAAMQPGVDPLDAVRTAFQALAVHSQANRQKMSRIYAIIQDSDELKSIERGYQHHIDNLVAFALCGHETYRKRRAPEYTPTLEARMFASVIFATIRPMYRAWLKGELRGSLVPYALAGWSLVTPVLEAARCYAKDAMAAYSRIDAQEKGGNGPD